MVYYSGHIEQQDGVNKPKPSINKCWKMTTFGKFRGKVAFFFKVLQDIEDILYSIVLQLEL